MRDIILRFVLGDRMIHIQYVTEDLEKILWPKPKDADEKAAEGGLCSAFCVAGKSEQEAYDEANHSSGISQAFEDPNFIEPCKERHKNCLMCGSKQSEKPVEGLQAERLTFDKNLSVLAVCRLLYEESNNILWQTNTFSFHDALSFKLFNAGMNPSQKHRIRKVHFSINMPIDSESVRLLIFAGWAKAIAPRTLTPLKNLKVLHLSFDQCCCEPSGGLHIPSTDCQLRVRHDMDTMLGLRLLPWKHMDNVHRGKHVTVIVSDDASTHWETATPRWIKSQKLDAAEKIRARLAAPNSAEVHDAEKDAEQEDKQRCTKRARRVFSRSLQTLIACFEPSVREAKEIAKQDRRKADWWMASHHHATDSHHHATQKVYYTDLAERSEEQYQRFYGRLVNLQAVLASIMLGPSD